MKWYKVTDNKPVVALLVKKLSDHISAGDRVLWLVSGGSAISIAVAVAKQLQSIDCHNVTVSLMDERYGEVGHTNENWRQLVTAGFVLPGAQLRPVLQGELPEATTADFAAFLKDQLAIADFRLGLFGMGEDGHTAGILPHTPAVQERDLACYYQTKVYDRITITPAGIEALDSAVLYAVGGAKHPALAQLQQKIPIAEQPAQCLKTITDVSICNDYQGEPL